MAALTSPDVVDLVGKLSRKGRLGLARIDRLSPAVATALVRLLGRSKGLDDAVDRYLHAAVRLEAHPNDEVARALLAHASDQITPQLSSLSGPDVDMLRREIAQRLAAARTDPAELEKQFRAALQRPSPPRFDRADPGLALLQLRFFERIGAADRVGAAVLLRARRKLLRAVGGRWESGWEPTFSYLRTHAVKLAASGRRVRAARAAVEAADEVGDPSAIRLASAELRAARKQAQGYRSKIKGLVMEAYAVACRDWRLLRASYRRLADKAARQLGPGWEVVTLSGSIRVNGKEAWDEAILLVDRTARPPQARLFMAAQFKGEKFDSAMGQILTDAARETATKAGQVLPVLTVDGTKEAFQLLPSSVSEPVHRFILNAQDVKFSASDLARLRAARVIRVEQFTLDLSNLELDQVVDAMVDVVTDTVP